MAEEGGAFGCALMAGVGAGHWKNLDEACGQAIQVAERIEPDAADLAPTRPAMRSGENYTGRCGD